MKRYLSVYFVCCMSYEVRLMFQQLPSVELPFPAACSLLVMKLQPAVLMHLLTQLEPSL